MPSGPIRDRPLRGFDLCRAAMSVTDVDSKEQSVLTVLALMANEDARCFPPIGGPTGLTGRTKLSERSVQRAIGRLVDLGHISRRQLRRGVIYTIHPRAAGVSPVTVTGDSVSGDHATPDAETVRPATVAPKQPLNHQSSTKASPSSKKHAGRKAAAVGFTPPDWVPREPWDGWADMRRRAGKSPSPRACELAVKKLEALADDGHPPADVLDQSTRNSWTDLYPIKDIRNERTGSPASRSGRPSNANGRGGTADAILAARDQLRFGGHDLGGREPLEPS